MAREDLIPLNERTKAEQKEIATKGGIESGKARRKKKAMKEAAQLLLSLKAPQSQEPTLESFGLKKKDSNNQMAMLAAAMIKAFDGDIKAMEFLRDTAGEKPVQSAEKEAPAENNLLAAIEESIKELENDL